MHDCCFASNGAKFSFPGIRFFRRSCLFGFMIACDPAFLSTLPFSETKKMPPTELQKTHDPLLLVRWSLPQIKFPCHISLFFTLDHCCQMVVFLDLVGCLSASPLLEKPTP
jgi:hypothetical protein